MDEELEEFHREFDQELADDWTIKVLYLPTEKIQPGAYVKERTGESVGDLLIVR